MNAGANSFAVRVVSFSAVIVACGLTFTLLRAADEFERETSNAATTQASVAERFARLEATLLKLSVLEKAGNPRRATLLEQALGSARKQQIQSNLAEISKLIGQKKFSEAAKRQVVAEKQLEDLLKFLTSEDRFERLKNQQEKLREQIAEVERLIRLQRSLQGETESGGDAKKLAGEQEELSKRTGKLDDEIAQDDRPDAEKEGGKESGKNDGAKNDDANKDGNKGKEGSEGKKGDSSKGKDGEKSESGSDKGKEGDENKSGEKGTDEKKGDKNGDKSGDSQKGKSGEGDKSKSDSPKSEGDKSDASKSGENAKEKMPGDKSGDEKGDDKQGNPKKGEPEKGDSQKSDGQKSESQKGDKSGQPKQGNQKQPMPPMPGDNAQQDDSSDDQQQQQPQNPVRRQLQQARKRMEEARKQLEQANRKKSQNEQAEAQAELEKAKAELERILRQLREEELERTLASLEARVKSMIERQTKVNEQTKQLVDIPVEQRSRDVEAQSVKLGSEQNKIAIEAERAVQVLQEEGSSTAFPLTMEQVREDMLQVGERLGTAKLDPITIELEDEILTSLNELLAALEKAKKEQQERKQQQQQQQQQDQQPQGEPEQPLVSKIAELKMIKTLQIRVNTRTQRYAKLLNDPTDPVGQANTKDLIDSLDKLSRRESEVLDITRELMKGAQ